MANLSNNQLALSSNLLLSGPNNYTLLSKRSSAISSVISSRASALLKHEPHFSDLNLLHRTDACTYFFLVPLENLGASSSSPSSTSSSSLPRLPSSSTAAPPPPSSSYTTPTPPGPVAVVLLGFTDAPALNPQAISSLLHLATQISQDRRHFQALSSYVHEVKSAINPDDGHLPGWGPGVDDSYPSDYSDGRLEPLQYEVFKSRSFLTLEFDRNNNNSSGSDDSDGRRRRRRKRRRRHSPDDDESTRRHHHEEKFQQWYRQELMVHDPVVLRLLIWLMTVHLALIYLRITTTGNSRSNGEYMGMEMYKLVLVCCPPALLPILGVFLHHRYQSTYYAWCREWLMSGLYAMFAFYYYTNSTLLFQHGVVGAEQMNCSCSDENTNNKSVCYYSSGRIDDTCRSDGPLVMIMVTATVGATWLVFLTLVLRTRMKIQVNILVFVLMYGLLMRRDEFVGKEKRIEIVVKALVVCVQFALPAGVSYIVEYKSRWRYCKTLQDDSAGGDDSSESNEMSQDCRM